MGFWSSLVSTLLGVGASLVAWYIIKSISKYAKTGLEIWISSLIQNNY